MCPVRRRRPGEPRPHSLQTGTRAVESLLAGATPTRPPGSTDTPQSCDLSPALAEGRATERQTTALVRPVGGPQGPASVLCHVPREGPDVPGPPGCPRVPPARAGSPSPLAVRSAEGQRAARAARESAASLQNVNPVAPVSAPGRGGPSPSRSGAPRISPARRPARAPRLAAVLAKQTNDPLETNSVFVSRYVWVST